MNAVVEGRLSEAVQGQEQPPLSALARAALWPGVGSAEDQAGIKVGRRAAQFGSYQPIFTANAVISAAL